MTLPINNILKSFSSLLDACTLLNILKSTQPGTLLIKGLSLFLSEPASLNVKIVNKDVVLFKSIDKEKNYSESGIITRKTGELIHEITKNIKSENSEKYISIYSCTENDKKV